MPLRFIFALLVITAGGCGKSASRENAGPADGPVEENPNQGLYNQVMAIHDEVMPKMDDLYKMKTAINEKLKEASDLSAEEREKLGELSSQLDEAGKSMMDWMHQFKPDDIQDEEQARAYLEDEMEKIKKVKQEVLEALEKARTEASPN